MAKKFTKGRKPSKKTSSRRKPASKSAPRALTLASLSNLRPPRGSRHRKVRVGRGIGSKLGKTSGSGDKGQKSRRGYSRRRGFEGGQMPLHRRMPKRGFHNPFSVEYSVLNLEELNVFPAGETVTPELLRAHGFVRRSRDRVKILGDGELTTKLAVHAHAFSASAKDKITKAGGTFEVVA
ncbi:MAG TPA: 50S ribosomal protein L15 [Candidatus Acidoferrum sp.]